MPRACQTHSKHKHKHHHTHLYVMIIAGITFALLAAMYQFFLVSYGQLHSSAELYGRVTDLELQLEELAEERDDLLGELAAYKTVDTDISEEGEENKEE